MTLPTLSVTKYKTTLPSSNEKIEYRPFLVKEEKIFLLAIESGSTEDMIQAIKNVIENCTFGLLNVNDLPVVDVEWLFLELRKKSKGETVDLVRKCPKCDATSEMNINLDDVKISGKMPENKIMIEGDIGIILNYPSFRTVESLSEDMTVNDQFKMIRDSIDCIFTEDEVFKSEDSSEEALDEFMESISEDKFKEIDNFFKKMPSLVWNKKIKCPACKDESTVKLSGLKSFLALD